MNSRPIRVRFAPSPTGFLHVGGLRTALYNYLFARKEGGAFVLRIEDTDRSRYVEGAIENLIDTLHWAGLEYDEGPGKEGARGPYMQSERLAVYREHANRLLENATAYRCFCPPERIAELRRQQEKQKMNPRYDRHCLSLSAEEIAENLRMGRQFVVRMKIPSGAGVQFHDLIRGDVEFANETLDDQVLIKSDGYPTYHLANVVDDHLMQVSHVIRGEEWLPSTPKHVLLYGFFGWDPPVFVHLPLLLNPDRTKLSKRQGDVAVEDYRSKGYLKEALVNFVALLGWNPGTEQELFTLDELVQEFSLEKVNKTGAVFDVAKLNWLNFEHLRRKSDAEVLALLKGLLAGKSYPAWTLTDDYLLSVIAAMRPRITFVRDILDKSPYFFEPPSTYDPEVIKKWWTRDTPGVLERLIDEFSLIPDGGTEEFEPTLEKVAQALGIEKGKIIHPLRVAISGVGGGPGIYDIVRILGRNECIARMRTAIATIQTSI